VERLHDARHVTPAQGVQRIRSPNCPRVTCQSMFYTANRPMRRALKILGVVVAALVAVVGVFLLYVQIDGIPRYPVEKVTFTATPTPERLARGKELVGALCAGCHMDPTSH